MLSAYWSNLIEHQLLWARFVLGLYASLWNPVLIIIMSDQLDDLLANFYGLAAEPDLENVHPLDVEGADTSGYVQSLIDSQSLPDLTATAEALEKDAANAEHGLRNLVYENYTKFMDATQAVVAMRAESAGLSERLQELAQSLSNAQQTATAITSATAGTHRELKETLEARARLARLSSLAALPQRVERAVELGAASAAVEYWLAAKPVLAAGADISSIAAIQGAAERAVSKLAKQLRHLVAGQGSQASPDDDDALPLSGVSKVDAMHLLIRLGDPVQDLLAKFIAWQVDQARQVVQGLHTAAESAATAAPAPTPATAEGDGLAAAASPEEAAGEASRMVTHPLLAAVMDATEQFLACISDALDTAAQMLEGCDNEDECIASVSAALVSPTADFFDAAKRYLAKPLTPPNPEELRSAFDTLRASVAAVAGMAESLRLQERLHEALQAAARGAIHSTFTCAQARAWDGARELLRKLPGLERGVQDQRAASAAEEAQAGAHSPGTSAATAAARSHVFAPPPPSQAARPPTSPAPGEDSAELGVDDATSLLPPVKLALQAAVGAAVRTLAHAHSTAAAKELAKAVRACRAYVLAGAALMPDAQSMWVPMVAGEAQHAMMWLVAAWECWTSELHPSTSSRVLTVADALPNLPAEQSVPMGLDPAGMSRWRLARMAAPWRRRVQVQVPADVRELIQAAGPLLTALAACQAAAVWETEGAGQVINSLNQSMPSHAEMAAASESVSGAGSQRKRSTTNAGGPLTGAEDEAARTRASAAVAWCTTAFVQAAAQPCSTALVDCFVLAPAEGVEPRAPHAAVRATVEAVMNVRALVAGAVGLSACVWEERAAAPALPVIQEALPMLRPVLEAAMAADGGDASQPLQLADMLQSLDAQIASNAAVRLQAGSELLPDAVMMDMVSQIVHTCLHSIRYLRLGTYAAAHGQLTVSALAHMLLAVAEEEDVAESCVPALLTDMLQVCAARSPDLRALPGVVVQRVVQQALAPLAMW